MTADIDALRAAEQDEAVAASPEDGYAEAQTA